MGQLLIVAIQSLLIPQKINKKKVMLTIKLQTPIIFSYDPGIIKNDKNHNLILRALNKSDVRAIFLFQTRLKKLSTLRPATL